MSKRRLLGASFWLLLITTGCDLSQSKQPGKLTNVTHSDELNKLADNEGQDLREEYASERPDGDVGMEKNKILEDTKREDDLSYPRMAPDGTYIVGTPRLAPDGKYVGGQPHMAPDGRYVSGTPQLAPDGTYVGGSPRLAPDGSYVGGTPMLAPDGKYVGSN